MNLDLRVTTYHGFGPRGRFADRVLQLKLRYSNSPYDFQIANVFWSGPLGLAARS